MTQSRLFTLEEANQLIPELQTHLNRLFQKKEDYARRHDQLFIGELLHEAENTHAALDRDLEAEIQKMEAAIFYLEQDLIKIREMGCILRNLKRGFVDFLGERNGESIYFCWKFGETSIRFYHPVKTRVQQRLPLDK